MEYRINQKNNDELSILGFGCMRFPVVNRKIDEPKATEMLELAIAQGVNYLDTAYIYHGGQSEVFLGNFLKKGYREKIKLATKLPHYLVRKASDIDKYFNQQLQRLQTDYINYYLIHMLSDQGVWQKLVNMGIVEWIAQKKASGHIINIGFSFHGIYQQFEKLIDIYPWDFCQIQYNYLDTHNQAGTAGLRYANSKGLPVIIMEPLRGGFLVDKLPKAALVLCNDFPKKPAVVGLTWIGNQPEVNLILSGMSSIEQVKENLMTASLMSVNSLADEDLQLVSAIKKLINKDIKVACTGCRYCLPCPYGVDIPACFAVFNEKYLIKSGNPLFKYIQNTGAATAFPGNAGLCRKCGACIKHCPQSIDIPNELTVVKQEFEGAVFKVACFGAKIILSSKG